MDNKSEKYIINQIPSLLKACKSALPQIRNKYITKNLMNEMMIMIKMLKSIPEESKKIKEKNIEK